MVAAPNATPAQAAALIIGNELLTGKIADANLVVLARTLRSIGVRLERAVTILDVRATIAAEVKELSRDYDLVFTSGGVGPTHDDVTIDGIADAFDVDVEPSAVIEAMLRGYYGDKITDGHLRMARVPVGARLVTTPEMPWPTVVMRNVWVLPGIPQIFALKMPVVLAELGGGTTRFESLAVYTMLDEGALKPLLDAVVAGHPDVELGSYPKWNYPHYRTKVTFDGVDAAAVAAACEAFRAILPEDGEVDAPPPEST